MRKTKQIFSTSIYIDCIKDTLITIKKWKLNFKFPFLHRIKTTYTIEQWYKINNDLLKKKIDEVLFYHNGKKC